jgi:hypothetical protein
MDAGRFPRRARPQWKNQCKTARGKVKKKEHIFRGVLVGRRLAILTRSVREGCYRPFPLLTLRVSVRRSYSSSSISRC